MARSIAPPIAVMMAMVAPFGLSGEAFAQQSPAAADRSVRGLVLPVDRATLAAGINAKIIKLPYRSGQRFKKGAELVGFDCRRYRAELSAAVAERNARTTRHANNQELAKLNGIAKLEVKLSKAELNKAKANVQVAVTETRECKIVAPYPGRVVEQQARLHESVVAGQAVLTILDDRTLEIELIVPSSWLGWMKAGATFEFAVDETGNKHGGYVLRLGAEVDAESQTIKVIGVLDEPQSSVLSGMSGTAVFAQ